MKYLLITADIDWADEFSCSMFGVFTDEQWKTLCYKTKKYFGKWAKGERDDNAFSESGEVEAGFGTNESLTFSDYKKWIGEFEVKEITEEQYNFLQSSIFVFGELVHAMDLEGLGGFGYSYETLIDENMISTWLSRLNEMLHQRNGIESALKPNSAHLDPLHFKSVQGFDVRVNSDLDFLFSLGRKDI